MEKIIKRGEFELSPQDIPMREFKVGSTYMTLLETSDLEAAARGEPTTLKIWQVLTPLDTHNDMVKLDALMEKEGYVVDFYKVLHNDETSMQLQCLTSGAITNEIHTGDYWADRADVPKH